MPRRKKPSLDEIRRQLEELESAMVSAREERRNEIALLIEKAGIADQPNTVILGALQPLILACKGGDAEALERFRQAGIRSASRRGRRPKASPPGEGIPGPGTGG